MKRKNLWLKAVTLLLPAVLLTACGSGTETSDDTFQVMFSAPYVDEEQVAAYGEKLSAEKEKTIEYQAYPIGTEEIDPMAYGASVMKISAMVAAGELDVMVCDLDNAARNARGEMYYDLTSIFTEDELAEYSDRLVSFDMVDEEGNPTGEKTPICGIDVSNNENLKNMMGENSYGVFIVGNTGDLELSKEIFWDIVNP